MTLDTWVSWEKAGQVYEEVGEAVSRHAFWAAHASHSTTEGTCIYFSLAGRGADPGQSRARFDAAWRSAIEACLRAGGNPNHHHNFGLAKLEWLDSSCDPERRSGWSRSKARFDPSGLMNPGKLCAPGGVR